MPHPPPNYSDFYQEPLTEDVELLLARFQQADSIRYEDFSSIWRDMRFSDVFLGIPNPGERKRFCRAALATALKYFLPPHSYQIRVGGLYLMFGLHQTQLTSPPLKVRLPLGDWSHVEKFMRDSVEAGHHDVVYIYRKLLATKAVHFTAMPHFLTFQKQQKPRQQRPVCADFLSRTTAVHDLMCADLLDEMRNIQSHYEKLKAATEGVGGQVSVVNPDLVSCLSDGMMEFITWQQKTFLSPTRKAGGGPDAEEDDDDDDDDEDPSGKRARLLSAIKQRSFSNFQEASKSRRHRQPERVDSSSSSSEQVQEASRRRRRRPRPPSLRARTWEKLGGTEDGNKTRTWLLSVPEHPTAIPRRRRNQPPTI